MMQMIFFLRIVHANDIQHRFHVINHCSTSALKCLFDEDKRVPGCGQLHMEYCRCVNGFL